MADKAPAVPEGDVRAVVASGANIADYVSDLARRHGVVYSTLPADDFADAIRHLSGHNAVLDGTENLLTALEIAGVINDEDALLLQAAHCRQTS
jgi:hypothetical protein